MSKYSNSSLVSYVKLSPNCTEPRNHEIDTITIHIVAGDCTVETLGVLFGSASRQASSNYGIGSDGRIGMYVEECNRSWCSSNKANDHRAVTIEVANITGAPEYKISDKAYESLINLCVDICRRNGIPKLLWKGDKSLIGQIDNQNMTVHRWFAAKACPGDWLYKNMGRIANDVNAKLNVAEEVKPEETPGTSPLTNEEKLWNFLDSKGLNDFAKAGLMANIFAESGFSSKNLQNSFEKKLGYNDETYTAAVDNGTYTNFVRDSAGYGLAQWTFWSRKQALLNYTKRTGRSIGDFDAHCEFLWEELQGYKSVIDVLRSATSVRQASDAVLTGYEKPADQSESVKVRRAGYGQDIYNRNANETSLPYKVRVTTDALNIRKGPGTNYAKAGMITNRGVYTIVEESTGKGASLWGKLKSGAGWIALSDGYVKKV